MSARNENDKKGALEPNEREISMNRPKTTLSIKPVDPPLFHDAKEKRCRLRIDTLIDAHCWIRSMDEKGRFELDEVPKENERRILSADGQKRQDRGELLKGLFGEWHDHI